MLLKGLGYPICFEMKPVLQNWNLTQILWFVHTPAMCLKKSDAARDK